MLIVFSGLPGTGKSALAYRIGGDLGLPVLSVDPIESAILQAGVARGFESGLAAYLVVQTLADSQLALGQGAIVDAVNSVEPAKEMWRALAEKHDLGLRIIECRCSDEIVHRQRLAARHRALPHLREPTWEDVEARRVEYTMWKEPLLAVDSVSSIEANAKRVLAWLRASAP